MKLLLFALLPMTLPILFVASTFAATINKSSAINMYEIDIYKDYLGNCSRTAYKLEGSNRDDYLRRHKIRSFESFSKARIQSSMCKSMKRGETRCLLHIQEFFILVGAPPRLYSEACYDQGARCLPEANKIRDDDSALSYKECSVN